MKWQEYTIQEVRKHIDGLNISDITEELIDSLNNDERIGIQKLADKCRRLLADEEARINRWEKMNQWALRLHDKGYHLIAGIDEAGRGPLAGPVVASAVILDKEKPIYGLDDSKKLTEKRRDELYEEIMKDALAVGIGIVDNKTIDEINILQATFQAMTNAVNELREKPDYILVDGNMKIPSLKINQDAVVDGDSFVNSIAAASIIAKVTRDRIIGEYHEVYPHYGFDRNKGYGTSEHIQALKEHGTTPIHRFSFSIVSKYHFTYYKNSIKQANNEDELKELGQLIARSSYFTEENLNKLRKLYQEKKYSIVNSFDF